MIDSYQDDDKENLPYLDILTNGNRPIKTNYTTNFIRQTKIQQPCQQQQLGVENKKWKARIAKPHKTLNSGVRAGDWICFICNNLNFSFRNECNRCQIQTKKQNYMNMQNLIQISEKKAGVNPDKKMDNFRFGNEINSNVERQVLRDLTNLPLEDAYRQKEYKIQEVQKINGSLNNLENHEFNGYSKDSSFNLPPGLNTLSIEIPQRSEGAFKNGISESCQYNDNLDDFEFSPNYGFENAILLTPPRFNDNESDSLESPDQAMVNSNKLLLPYQSPTNLPSVSPILRKVLQYNEFVNLEDFSKARSLKYKGITMSKSLYEKNSGEEKSELNDNPNIIDHEAYNCNEKIQQNLGDLLGDNLNFDDINRYLEEKAPNNVHRSHHNGFLLNKGGLDPNGINNIPQKDKFHGGLSDIQENLNVLFSRMSIDEDISPNSIKGNDCNSKNKSKKEKKVDWVCKWCSNLNYSFRKFCNRCQAIR